MITMKVLKQENYMAVQLLTKRQLAERLNVSQDCIWRLAKAGRIPQVVLAPHVRRFDFEEVMEALKQPMKAKVSES